MGVLAWKKKRLRKERIVSDIMMMAMMNVNHVKIQTIVSKKELFKSVFGGKIRCREQNENVVCAM